MLDQLYGRPSISYKRTQVFLVLLFWLHRLLRGDPRPPPLPFFRSLNRVAQKRFTPWQIVLSTLVSLYAIKHSDALLGLQAPEPLSRLYSKSYYRATWIVTALDAGFATAMEIKPKWLRDIFSVAFSGYYLFFASEADEKLRKFRAVCTVEMLRATWEKTSNPYIRLVTRGDRPRIRIHRKILLPRPAGSKYSKPITAWLFFDGTELELATKTELVFDIPGGGFICMTPEHHEERLLRWSKRTCLPVLSFDYGKAPEYPFPFAIDEMFDAYKLLYETKGKSIGMSGRDLRVIMTGDSAGANISTAFLIKLLETTPRLPLPIALVYAYAALSFHFTSWMPASDLRVLRQESSTNIAGLLRGKDHLDHKSPLSVVDEDMSNIPGLGRRRTTSWGRRVGSVVGLVAEGKEEVDEKSLQERVVWWEEEDTQKELQIKKDAEGEGKKKVKGLGETRLAMTSRTAFFNDRIISPPMCRAMALLYIGPRNAPDLHSDYHISPIFTPPNLLSQFPPVYMSCGERDPFVDDTVIFAGKLREAKEARKLELIGRGGKFGESLRMSSSPSSAGGGKRDPILDEDEADWVTMRIISGWSHGYLQMSSLLPGAVHAIDMMADWISLAFQKHEEKHPSIPVPRPSASLPVRLPLLHPFSSSSSSSTPALKASSPLATSSSSPSSGINTHANPSSNDSSAASSSSAFPFSPIPPPPPKKLAEEDEDDEEVLSFTPKKRGSRTGSPAPGKISPPSSASSTLSHRNHRLSSSGSFTIEDKKDLVGPVERALSSDLGLGIPHGHGATGQAAGGGRRFTDPPRPSSPLVSGGGSDEDGTGRLEAQLMGRAGSKSGRSDSAGALERPEKSGVFVDAKDLLKRRRVEAVFAMGGSRGGSDDEEDEDDERVGRKA